MSRLINLLIMLRTRLWLIPGAMVLAAMLVAYVMVASGADLLRYSGPRTVWLFGGDAETARSLLSTILSGMMTMTSLVVSVTFVILSLAASQLGPRLISIFMGDRQIQAVLGFFLGTIVYLLLIFRSLDQSLGPDGVPATAVTLASLLTLLCLFALLLYVHKIARLIIADTIVDSVARDLMRSIVERLPRSPDTPPPPPATAPQALQQVPIGTSGYLQTIDYAALVRLACECDAVFRVTVRAGHFIMVRGCHVEVFAKSTLDGASLRRLRRAFITGPERSPAQDLEYSIRQLVEIALRALSPGINDPFTAIAVVDRLGEAAEEIATRDAEPSLLQDGDGTVRVMADRSSIAGLFDAAFDPIRQAAGACPAVLIRMSDMFGQLAPALQGEAARSATEAHLRRLRETATAADLVACDRQALLERITEAEAAVAAPGAR